MASARGYHCRMSIGNLSPKKPEACSRSLDAVLASQAMILVRNPPMCFAHSATMMLLGRLVMRTSTCSRRRWPISLGRLARIFGRLLRNSRLGIIRSVRQGSFIRLDSNPAVEPAPSSIRRTELGTSRSSMPRLAASRTSTSQPCLASPAAKVSIVRSVPPIGSD